MTAPDLPLATVAMTATKQYTMATFRSAVGETSRRKTAAMTRRAHAIAPPRRPHRQFPGWWERPPKTAAG